MGMDERPPLDGMDEKPPLHGVRVLDFTRVIAGPYCTMMLADLGAEVVKVEQPPRGDELRWLGRYSGRGPDDEDYFYASNRTKKSILLDLKDPDGLRTSRELAARADVIVENFAPGTMERLGVGWEQLQAINPKLVYCSVSGFGQTGPYRGRLAMDPIIQAMSGVMSVTGAPDGEPMGIGAPVADAIGGMFAAYAIVGSLYAVQRGGPGRYIDVSMLDAMIAVLGPRMGETLQAGRSPDRLGNENPMRVPAGLFRGSDGEYVNLIVQNDNYWAPFCRALEREEWIDDARFADSAGRIANRAELNALVGERFAERPATEWVERLTAHRVPAATVNSYAQALSDPQVAHRGLVREVEHPRSGRIRVVGPPWISSAGEVEVRPPPLLGQHTEEVLREWLGRASHEGTKARRARRDTKGF
jgi:formyl-CoA transferase